MTAPRAERPRLFGNLPKPGAPYPVLPWRWAEARLEGAPAYWIAATRPDGRPYARPVWGAWIRDQLIVTLGSPLLWSCIRGNPSVTVHLDDADQAVILEGVASWDDAPPHLDRELLAEFLEIYNPKYEWDATLETLGAVVAVAPQVVFGWLNDRTGRDRGASYKGTATKWTF